MLPANDKQNKTPSQKRNPLRTGTRIVLLIIIAALLGIIIWQWNYMLRYEDEINSRKKQDSIENAKKEKEKDWDKEILY